jgi:hypothetical protein
MKVQVLEQDQTLLREYETDAVPYPGADMRISNRSYRVASITYMEYSVRIYVDPVPEKGYVSPSTFEERDPYPLYKSNT